MGVTPPLDWSVTSYGGRTTFNCTQWINGKLK
jgi:hypothetical protein